MSENKIKLKDDDVDELCNILLDHINAARDWGAEIRSLRMRFSVEYDSADGDFIPFTSKRAVQDIVYYIRNEKENFYNFLSYLVSNDMGDFDRYDALLKKYGYTIELSDKKFIIVPLSDETFQQEMNELQGFIETNAPQKTLDHLKEAKEKFAKNDFDGTLSECRLALESLTKNGNISKGIEELESLSLITNANDRQKKGDGWMLKAVYGYDSTLGSHTTSTRTTDQEQAFLGLVITQASIRYILKKLQEAKQQGKQIHEWAQ